MSLKNSKSHIDNMLAVIARLDIWRFNDYSLHDTSKLIKHVIDMHQFEVLFTKTESK